MRHFITTIINIIAAIVAVAALSLLQLKYPDNNYKNALKSSSFETSDEFLNILNDRLDDVFLYVQLKNCFETNNKLNYDITVAESIDNDNNIKRWTLKECLDAATAHGLFIDSDFTINILTDHITIPFSKNITYNFIFKVYPSNIRTGTSNEEDFLTDFMYCLAKYYKCKFKLDGERTNFQYRISFTDSIGNQKFQYTNTSLTNKDILNSNAFVYLSSVDNITSSNINSINSSTLKKVKSINPILDSEFTLYCHVNTNYQNNDDFREKYTVYNNNKHQFAILTTTVIYSSLFFIVSLLLTLMFILATKKHVNESQRLFFMVPTELYILIYIIIVTISFFSISSIFSSEKYANFTNINQVKANLYLLIIYVSSMLLFAILTAKYENDSLTPLLLKSLKENSEYGEAQLNVNLLFFTIFIPIILLAILSVYLFYLSSLFNDIRILVAGIILLITIVGFAIYILLLHSAFNKAIQEQIKSSEMRTSLIANVSHDIKTPLTSILTYTDLITEEINHFTKDSKKNLEKYSGIIINKSHRLNDLINDLIFDSKVSSGNIELNMVPIDLNAFLSQVIVEFTDKLNENGIKIIYNNTAKNVNILADSSQLYRVYQNLFSNIYKYALENSRVYIDLESVKSKTITTIKNIQKEKLEVKAETLKDRFVRGSKSRTTEGFGLGLSIAESLISSMNGKLDIRSSRDLFTAKITFLGYESQ